MLVYKGIAALSDFRKQKLLARLQTVDASVLDVSAEYVHLVDDAKKLSAKQESELRELLDYGLPFSGKREGLLVLVVPRPGTISPWSTKATDIARNSGLSAINRIERGIAYYIKGGNVDRFKLAPLLHDRMTEAVLGNTSQAKILFAGTKPKPLVQLDIQSGKQVLTEANKAFGFALADDEIDYLFDAYSEIGRNPTDVELMMFAQVNSEHCRHKIFNADWIIDGQKQPKSLFKMVKNTYEKGGQNVLSAYSDNAAVLSGPKAGRFFADPKSGEYGYSKEPIHTVIKVETHNHPTAIAPDPGAATGVGGEIRDEGATGRGAKSKMGLAGYTVSNLRIPGLEQPWEKPYGKPGRIASALDIMLESPIGAAAFANEFGRPNLTGYFRTYEQEHSNEVWGYHKPIMIAGGLGNIRDEHVEKQTLPVGALVIVLGGPSMLIGLGGGAASSMQTGESEESLDFASVQRANAEMERRAQEVIDRCWAMGKQNPIITIHDVGAGGLSNALPELVHDSGRGAEFEIREVPSAEPGLSPLEIWCNESQERYVLGITKGNLEMFKKICERERCQFAVVGQTTKREQLVVHDSLFKNNPVDLPMSVLFGKPPKMTRTVAHKHGDIVRADTRDIVFSEAVKRVLHVPAVGSKKFLITIGDRNVGGMVARDQMVGPWQVPVSDAAVTAVAFDTNAGEAMAMGERTPLALTDAPASARMAVAEAIMNIAAAEVVELSDIKLSANWMAAAGYKQEDEHLFDAVETVGEDFCPELGITIPVGKDSLSMRTVWKEKGRNRSVTAPLSLIISAFSPVKNVLHTLTPQLKVDTNSVLIVVDLGKGKNRLGGSALMQAYNQVGSNVPDIDPTTLKQFFRALQTLKKTGKVLAYHDRSDGGLFATLCEMAFASRCGLDIDLTKVPGTLLDKLFNEELGAVLQANKADEKAVLKAFGKHAYSIGHPIEEQVLTFRSGKESYTNSRAQLEAWWSETSYHLQKMRDNPVSAEQEFQAVRDDNDPGLSGHPTFKLNSKTRTARPKVAIFREQGVNGQTEMAAAFDRAGFASVDVHLNDIISGRFDLDGFVGLVACGGFSYGDVLGAGEGWAKSVLFNAKLRAKFQNFFERPDTFSLGVCNGCQMFAALKSIIPGAENWPTFLKNSSEQFEARLVMAQINESPSILLKDMAGSTLPVPVAHGEGRAQFANDEQVRQAIAKNLVAMQYVDNYGRVTEAYPANPNGSPLGITALTTPNGRATILMPHPERAYLTRQLSWHPDKWGNESPWFKLFQNARDWVG